MPSTYSGHSMKQNVDIAASISGEELKILQEYFSNIEEVNEESFIKLFRSLGGKFADVDENDYLKFFQKVDANANGMLDLDELLTFLLVGAEGQRRMNDLSKDTSNIKWYRGNNTISNVHKGKIHRIIVDASNDKYYTASKDGSVKVWNAQNLLYEKTLHQSVHSLTDMHHIKKYNVLVTCDLGRKLYFYDLNSRRLDRIFQGNLSNFHPMSNNSKGLIDGSTPIKSPSRFVGGSPSRLRKDFLPEIKDRSGEWKDERSHEKSNDWAPDIDRGAQKNVGIYPTVTLEKLGKRGNIPMSVNVYHSPSSQDLLILGCENGKVKIYDITDKILDSYSLKPLFSGQVTPSTITSMAVGYDLSVLIVAGHNPAIEVFSLEKYGTISTLRGHKKPVYKVDFSNSLNLIVSCGREKNIMVWNPLIQKPLEVLKVHDSAVLDVQFNTKDMELITLSDDKILKIWDIRMYKCMQTFQNIGGTNATVTSAVFNSKQECVVCGGFEYGRAELIAVPLQRSHLSFKAKYNGPSHPIVAVLLKKNFGELIISDEYNVSIWNYIQGDLIYKFSVPEGIASCSFDPNERRIIVSHHSKNVGIYNYINGACLKKLNSEEEIYNCLYIDSTDTDECLEEDRAIWGLGDHCIYVWSDADGDEREDSISTITLPFSGLCGTVVENSCLIGFEDGTLRLYDAHSGGVKISKKLRQPSSIYNPVSWSYHDIEKKRNFKWSIDTNHSVHVEAVLQPPEKYPLAIVSYGNGTIEFRNMIHLECSYLLKVNPNDEAICAMSVDSQGNRLITGDSDGFIAIFDISMIKIAPPTPTRDSYNVIVEKDVQLIHRFRAFNDVVTSVVYDEDRRLITAGCSNTLVGIWNEQGTNIGYFGQTQKWEIDNPLTYGLGRNDKPIRKLLISTTSEEDKTTPSSIRKKVEITRDLKIDLDDIENELSKKIAEKYKNLQSHD